MLSFEKSEVGVADRMQESWWREILRSFETTEVVVVDDRMHETWCEARNGVSSRYFTHACFIFFLLRFRLLLLYDLTTSRVFS